MSCKASFFIVLAKCTFSGNLQIVNLAPKVDYIFVKHLSIDFLDRARDKRNDRIVALKKVRMENEKDGMFWTL